MADVYVVVQPIAGGTPGEEIEASVVLEQVPAKVRAAGAVIDLADLADRVAAVDLQPGEQLLDGRFIDVSEFADREAGVKVPDDMIEVTIELDPQRAVGGLLEPGQTVAVLASFEPFELSATVVQVDGEEVALPEAVASEIDGATRTPPRLHAPQGGRHRGPGDQGAGPSPATRRSSIGWTTAPEDSVLVTLAVRPGRRRASGVQRRVRPFVWLAVERDTVPEASRTRSGPGATCTTPRKGSRLDERRSPLLSANVVAGEVPPRATTARPPPVRRVWSDQWRDPAEVAMDACAANPELLLIGSDLDTDLTRAVVADVDRRYRATTTVVLTAVADVGETVELLRLGARDVLTEAPGTGEFRERIGDLLDLARDRHGRSGDAGTGPRRRVITVVSPKGGSGKTTLSTNLAVGLARRMPKQVLLIDLDLQFGDCAAALGLKPEHSLINVVGASTHERTALKVFLTGHPSGLLLLPPPDDLVAVDDIRTDDLKQTVTALTDEFPFVVIDTGGGIDAAAMAAMELSTDLLLVTTTDVPSITLGPPPARGP